MTDTCKYQAETEYGFIEVCDQEEAEHPEYVPDGFDEHEFTPKEGYVQSRLEHLMCYYCPH